MQRYDPAAMWRNLRSGFAELWASQKEIPRQLVQIVQKLERGELRLNFHLDHLERLVGTMEHSSNRLTLGIIIAALIIGSSMIITTGVGPFIFGFPALGVIGYIISAILGLWLVVTIIKTDKY